MTEQERPNKHRVLLTNALKTLFKNF